MQEEREDHHGNIIQCDRQHQGVHGAHQRKRRWGSVEVGGASEARMHHKGACGVLHVLSTAGESNLF